MTRYRVTYAIVSAYEHAGDADSPEEARRIAEADAPRIADLLSTDATPVTAVVISVTEAPLTEADYREDQERDDLIDHLVSHHGRGREVYEANHTSLAQLRESHAAYHEPGSRHMTIAHEATDLRYLRGRDTATA